METNNFPKMIIIHHTSGTDANPLADTSSHTFEMVDTYHRSKGWDGIGYHWFIEKNGKIKKGRDETKVGAHTVGYNDKSIGICLAGNFDFSLPTESQIQALTKLMGEIMSRYALPASEIYPHRKFAKKTCYGTRLSDTWASELMVTEKLLKKQPDIVIGEYDLQEIKKSVANKEVNGLFQLIKKLFNL